LDRSRSAAIGAYRPSPRAALFKKKVENLAAALSEPSAAAEAGEIIRSLIDRIVLTPVGDAQGRTLRRLCDTCALL
jgi:hypothetical protein